MPVIITMFQKGYNKERITQKIAEALKVGKTNKYLKRLVYDSYQAYLGSVQEE